METASGEEIYDPRFVRSLFDRMAATYGTVNLITSFGFTVRWRRQCVATIPVNPGARVFDLMTGMGELFGHIGRRIGPDGRLTALDISSVMCERAERNLNGLHCSGEVLQADVLESELPWGTADAVFSSFGLKTFSPEQQVRLAERLARLLRPGGRFSFLEISVPDLLLLRAPYMLYLERIVPQVGRLFLGDPDNYRLLGIYTRAFGNSHHFVDACRQSGLECTLVPFFFGCATAAIGRKPPEN